MWIPEECQTFSPETLAFFQLRSVALKALCISLENNDNVKVILEDPELLQKMIEIAVAPTDLDEYQSIETLEEISERLVERIVDKSTGIDEWVPSLQKPKTHREILLKSVYRYCVILFYLFFSLQMQFFMCMTPICSTERTGRGW